MLNREKLYNEFCRLDGVLAICTDENLRAITGAVSCLYSSLYTFHIDGYDGIKDAREYLHDVNHKYSINMPPDGWSYCINSSIKDIIGVIEAIDGICLLDFYSDVFEVHIDQWIEILLEYVDQILNKELLGEGE